MELISYYMTYGTQKRGDYMSPRTGRPTESRKNHDIKVRVDEPTHEKLLQYCEKHGVTKAEAIRQGIQLVLQKK